MWVYELLSGHSYRFLGPEKYGPVLWRVKPKTLMYIDAIKWWDFPNKDHLQPSMRWVTTGEFYGQPLHLIWPDKPDEGRQHYE
jgi:hypothetical protein